MPAASQQKIRLFVMWMALFFSVLVGRLYYLQIIRGDYFLERSESNFVQERTVKHSRGKIFSSDGQVLVDNRLSYDVYVTFALLPDSLKNLRAIAGPLKLSKEDIVALDRELLLRARHGVVEPMTIADYADPESCKKIAEEVRTEMISGVDIEYFLHGVHERCKVSILSRDFPSNFQAQATLNDLLQTDEEMFRDKWQSARKRSLGLGRFKPSLLISDVGFDAYVRIENAISLGDLAGVTVTPAKRRRYINDDFASHLVGFVNQVSTEELRDGEGLYRGGDFIGRNGLEASFEDYLRGQDGLERVVVDAKGRRFSESWEEGLLGARRYSEPVSGLSLVLSIDQDIQRKAEELFTGLSGSVVVIDAKTGFILALASFPDFNPNAIVSADNAKYFNQLITDSHRPMRNKAVQDHYSPGSIFKPITAVAGLSNDLITVNSSHTCTGVFQIHKTRWRCFRRYGHGPLHLLEALKVSCDSYFYDLGSRLGLDALSETSRRFGFGTKTGISLLGETPGIVPSSEYYKKRFGYVAPGFVVNMSIGQGDISVSPLQMAIAYAAIANGGTVFKPQVVKKIIDDDGKIIKEFPSEVKEKITDKSFGFNEILKGLSFVTEQGGSAFGVRFNPQFRDIAQWLSQEKISVVGKTGTAQVVRLAKNIDHVKLEDVPYKHRDHAWFVGIYPKVNPEIVVTVMTEHGGYGGATSAPVAIRLMREWHQKNRTDLETARNDS